MEFVYFLIVGAVAGWLGSLLFKGSGSGLILNIVLGIVGAIVGGWLFGQLGIATGGLGGSILTAAIGAFLLLWIFSLFSGRR